jgi:hypothetical protein
MCTEPSFALHSQARLGYRVASPLEKAAITRNE